MEEFKVGDWVRDTRQGMKKPIAQLKPNCIALTNPEEYATHYIPWVPEVGEIYWDKYNGHLCKCSSTIKSKSGTVDVFGFVINPSLKIQSYSIKVSCLLSQCEPFIGELPTFLKDNA